MKKLLVLVLMLFIMQIVNASEIIEGIPNSYINKDNIQSLINRETYNYNCLKERALFAQLTGDMQTSQYYWIQVNESLKRLHALECYQDILNQQ